MEPVPVRDHTAWLQRRLDNRRAWTIRLAGYAVMAAGVVWLALAEWSGLLGATLTMACGAAIAVASAAWIGRKEAKAGHPSKKAFQLLLSGYSLKLAAVPVIALGGGLLVWGGAAIEVAWGITALGLCAYAYGVVARMQGMSHLPASGGWR